MDTEEDGDQNHPSADDFLRQAKEKFRLNPSSGLYQPESRQREQKIDVQVNAQIAQPMRPPESSKGNWAEIVGTFINSVSLLISLATVFGLALTVWLASGQWHQMIISNQNAASALEQTKNANRDSSRAFVAAQRAYISPSVDFDFVHMATDSNRLESLRVAPVWTNSGDTPTLGFITHGSEEFRADPLPANFSFPDKWSGNAPHIHTHVVVGPKVSATSYITTIPLPIMDLMADEKFKVFIYGWAKYRDIFPDTKEHITRYCWEIKVNRISGSVAQGRETFSHSSIACGQDYNCADEECKLHKSQPPR